MSKDDLTVDVSVHDFSGSEGATLAQRWFGDQRANDLGLTARYKTRAQLEEELEEGEGRPVNIEALDNIVIDAYSNDTEYTLYARQGTVRVPRPGATYHPTSSFVSLFLENLRSAAGAAKLWPIRYWRKSLAWTSSRDFRNR